jgi:hypothetical protein
MNIVIRAFQFFAYVIIQILFIPLAILGLGVGLYKEMIVGKRLGISYSAGQALQYRWMMHFLRPVKIHYLLSLLNIFLVNRILLFGQSWGH